MFIKKLLLIGYLFLLGVPNADAMICRTVGSQITNDAITITEAIAVPDSLAAGTVLWRQPMQNIDLECWVDVEGSPTENVYFYSKSIDSGPDIATGVTFQGKDYLSSDNVKVNTGWSIGGCVRNCGTVKIKKSMTYSIFFTKKSPAGAGKEGTINKIPDFLSFQIEGVGGTRPSGSYNLTVKGMDKFKYLPCESKISILPSTIDFGLIKISGAKNGSTIKEVPFSINEQRTCSSAYGLNGQLEPLTSTPPSNKDTLIPNDNKSVGIRIIDSDNQQPLEFKKEFVLTPKTTSLNNSRSFVARLIWMTETPTLGNFNAGAILNIYYK